jgi:hypothetical protein
MLAKTNNMIPSYLHTLKDNFRKVPPTNKSAFTTPRKPLTLDELNKIGGELERAFQFADEASRIDPAKMRVPLVSPPCE